MRASVLARRKPANVFGLSRRLLRDLDTVTSAAALSLQSKNFICSFSKGGWSALPRNDRRYRSFSVFHQIEQSPDPMNRVTLGQSRDPLGSRTLEVHWRWSHEDARRVERAQQLMAEAFRHAGLGEFRIATKHGLPDIHRPSGTHHLMGSTRMHDNPKLGVVDTDCRVHGMANLFLAGSSTFPTGGYANPTLTIVALALRLADRLKDELRRQAEPLQVRQPDRSKAVTQDMLVA